MSPGGEACPSGIADPRSGGLLAELSVTGTRQEQPPLRFPTAPVEDISRSRPVFCSEIGAIMAKPLDARSRCGAPALSPDMLTWSAVLELVKRAVDPVALLGAYHVKLPRPS